jgi:hypothetical protein
MAEPVNRTILLMDVEGFGSRDDVEQTVVRRMLYSVLQDTLTAAGVEPTMHRTEDRGDAVFVLVSPSVPKPRLLRALLTETPMRLHASNRLAGAGTQVRLRTVLAAGEVALDEYGGAVGADLVQAFRLLNAEGLRTALRESAGPMVLSVTDQVFRGVVRHGHLGIRPGDFWRITAPGKGREEEVVGWVHDPAGRPATRGPEATGSLRPVVGGTAGAAQVAGDDGAAEAGGAAGGAAPGGRAAGGGTETTGGSPSPLSGLRLRSANLFLGGSPSFGGDAVAGDKHVRTPEPGRLPGAGPSTGEEAQQ